MDSHHGFLQCCICICVPIYGLWPEIKFYYYLPSGFLSLRKEEPLPELSPQMPVSGYSWPRRTQVADKAVSPSCFRSSLPSCPFSWCPLCHSFCRHMLSLNHAMCPAHPCIPFLITSMISFTPVRCRIQELRLWSRRVMPSMMCEPSSVPMSHCRTP